jgi:hypothetical protein
MGARKGQGRGEDAASARRIEAAEKRARALELRKAGATYDQIAQRLGFSNRGNAQRAVLTALKEITAEPAVEVRQLELERLDAMLLGLWQQARNGDVNAVDRALRIAERRAKLLGLDPVPGVGALAQGAFAAALEDAPHRHPAEVLLDCVHTADVLLTAARRQVESGEMSVEALQALRSAMDQAARWAEKTLALDVASREQRAFEQTGSTFISVLERVLDGLELTDKQRAQVPALMQQELRAITGGGT